MKNTRLLMEQFHSCRSKTTIKIYNQINIFQISGSKAGWENKFRQLRKMSFVERHEIQEIDKINNTEVHE